MPEAVGDTARRRKVQIGVAAIIVVALVAALLIGRVRAATDAPITRQMVVDQLQAHNLRADTSPYTAEKWYGAGNIPTPTPREIFSLSMGAFANCSFVGFVYGSESDAQVGISQPRFSRLSAFRHKNLVVQYGEAAATCDRLDLYLALISDLP